MDHVYTIVSMCVVMCSTYWGLVVASKVNPIERQVGDPLQTQPRHSYMRVPKMDGFCLGKCYQHGWFGGTPISGNLHITIGHGFNRSIFSTSSELLPYLSVGDLKDTIFLSLMFHVRPFFPSRCFKCLKPNRWLQSSGLRLVQTHRLNEAGPVVIRGSMGVPP